MKFNGKFWNRKYKSDIDIAPGLTGNGIDTPLKQAFVDACMAVEDFVNLAEVEVSLVSKNKFKLSAKGPSKHMAVMVYRCPKCSAITYGGSHPMNGCEVVLIEEVMLT